MELISLNGTASPQPIDQEADNYSEILNKLGVAYSQEDNYYWVGQTDENPCWIIHLSTIISQLDKLLDFAIPFFLKENLSFKIPVSKKVAKLILDGNFGINQLGKVVSIHVPDAKEIERIAMKLVKNTANFSGPAIPTDINLGNTVYVRYGIFNPSKNNRYPATNVGSNSDTEHISTKYSIPFRYPSGVTWPFTNIREPNTPLPPKLLNGLYKPIETIKPDLKGNVLKGLYLKSLLNVKPCIIKEGKKGMWSDEYGRDIQTRLLWQKELYTNLNNQVPLPKIFDVFVQDGNLYLVMEFIKGVTLDNLIAMTYKGSSWRKLSDNSKRSLLNFLIQIVEIVEKIHNAGFVHRDLTPVNFIIKKDRNIYLIDMELAYSIKDAKPLPPFKLGTFGYMSDEQLKQNTPTTKEDIYGLGSLMAVFFTGFSPLKVLTTESDQLIPRLTFFTDLSSISKLISNCWESDPLKRPDIKEIKATLQNCVQDIGKATKVGSERNKELITSQEIARIIERDIKDLSDLYLTESGPTWYTKASPNKELIGDSQFTTSKIGFYNGLAGLLYLFAKAKEENFDISSTLTRYQKAWDYMSSNYLDNLEAISGDLYEGKAGIALSLDAAIRNGLLAQSRFTGYLQRLFEVQLSALNVRNGLAGQGLALLQCKEQLPSLFVKTQLENYVAKVLEAQLRDGSWTMQYSHNGSEAGIPFGLSEGICGVINFLLSYHSAYPNTKVLQSITRAVGWLMKSAIKRRGKVIYYVSTKARNCNVWSLNSGMPGVALTFIRLYRSFSEPEYKNMSEAILRNTPEDPVYADFTLANGLAGLGEVYIEAGNVFKTEEWKERADLITRLFYHTHKPAQENLGSWSMDVFDNSENSLMTGTLGVIHYLIRWINSRQLYLPLFNDCRTSSEKHFKSSNCAQFTIHTAD